MSRRFKNSAVFEDRYGGTSKRPKGLLVRRTAAKPGRPHNSRVLRLEGQHTIKTQAGEIHSL